MAELVAITICVNYADYLGTTLPHNVESVDRIYIGTSKTDEGTQELCNKYPDKVKVFLFDDETQIRYNRAKFNKSGLVRYIQEYAHRTHPDAWILILDADILLPNDIKASVESHAVEKNSLYGMLRHDYHTMADYTAQKRNNLYPLKHAGYFQLYFDKSKYYPTFSKDCSACDIVFQRLFHHRPMLPGHACHLGKPGVNWYGRMSPAWS